MGVGGREGGDRVNVGDRGGVGVGWLERLMESTYPSIQRTRLTGTGARAKITCSLLLRRLFTVPAMCRYVCILTRTHDTAFPFKVQSSLPQPLTLTSLTSWTLACTVITYVARLQP